MKRKSITQEYFILATNEKGKMSYINGTEAEAGIMDLLIGEVIELEKKKRK